MLTKNINFIFTVLFILISIATQAQKINIAKDTTLSQRQKDRLFLNRAGANGVAKIKKELTKTWNKMAC